MMRAAIYARYSSDLQSEASIDDQVRQCRARIAQEEWTLTEVYSDAAISGATVLRPGYQKMLGDARSGAFDIVVAEALDRLSRDQEDIAGLYKQFSFVGVTLITLSEGEITELHIGLKGTMNALFLKDLAQKTRRGLEGRVRQGFSGGGNAFGYDVVRETDAHGEPIRGKRRINQAEAAIVRRIFEEFVQGRSPRAIAKTLNQEGVPGPKVRPWRDTTIRGHHTRRTGILRNDLYVGRLVWNKQHYVKDPWTGKRLARPNPEDQWIVEAEDVRSGSIADVPNVADSGPHSSGDTTFPRARKQGCRNPWGDTLLEAEPPQRRPPCLAGALGIFRPRELQGCPPKARGESRPSGSRAPSAAPHPPARPRHRVPRRSPRSAPSGRYHRA